MCGVPLPEGLQRGSRLPEPIFTPATKAELGEHDEHIAFERACDVAGRKTMEQLRDTSLAIYSAAHEYAAKRGVILADTKFEFGYPLGSDGQRSGELPIVVDEVLTPDSSRYWPADTWTPGGEQVSYDKQFVRDYLQTLTASGRWDKTAGPDGLGRSSRTKSSKERSSAIGRRLIACSAENAYGNAGTASGSVCTADETPAGTTVRRTSPTILEAPPTVSRINRA